MPHLVSLGFEVALEGGFAGDGGGDAFGDADAGFFEGGDFFGVVRDEADGGRKGRGLGGQRGLYA